MNTPVKMRPLREVLPEAEQGIARVEHFKIPKGYVSWSAIQHGGHSPKPGQYVRLILNGKLVMSDTYAERCDHSYFIYRAHGHVLIGGLGIGYVLREVLAKPEVESVVVVENCQDVIDVVAPAFQCRRLVVEHADILTWKPLKGMTWNAIWFDIWADACTDNLADMSTLHRRFGRRLDRSGKCYMSSWKRDYLRSEKRRERRDGCYIR